MDEAIQTGLFSELVTTSEGTDEEGRRTRKVQPAAGATVTPAPCAALRSIPRDYPLLEIDAPHLHPDARVRTCTPGHLGEVGEWVARLRKERRNDLLEVPLRNGLEPSGH